MNEYPFSKILKTFYTFCLTLSFMICLSVQSFAQYKCSAQDSLIFNKLMQKAEKLQWKQFSIGKIITLTGEQFIQTPYVANTLNQSDQESDLIINLTGLDCTTYVEQVLAMAQCIKNNQTHFGDFTKALTSIRYRDGKQQGYLSRLHYFTDWIYDHQKRGMIEDITPQLDGLQMDKNINFMSTHRKSYAPLADAEIFKGIQEIERQINQRQQCYLPKTEIPKHQVQIQDGDLITLVTTIKGLDVSHVGFAHWVGNELHFMHASSKHGVMITSVPLVDYLMKFKSNKGIIVLRAL